MRAGEWHIVVFFERKAVKKKRMREAKKETSKKASNMNYPRKKNG